MAGLKTIPDIKHWVEHHDENMDENKTEWIEPRHCTAYYDVSGGNVNYANEVQNALGVEFNIATSDL